MSTTTDSVLNPESSAVDTAALIAEIQGDLNALALKLAQSRIHGRTAALGYQCCGDCLAYAKASIDAIPHASSCIVGNIIKLSARLGDLRDRQEMGRLEAQLADAFAASAGKVVPLEYPQVGGCRHCGPICHRGAAHNARVEDGVFFADPQPERHIEYSPIAGRGVAAVLDPAPSAAVERVTYEEAAERNRAGLAVRA